MAPSIKRINCPVVDLIGQRKGRQLSSQGTVPNRIKCLRKIDSDKVDVRMYVENFRDTMGQVDNDVVDPVGKLIFKLIVNRRELGIHKFSGNNYYLQGSG